MMAQSAALSDKASACKLSIMNWSPRRNRRSTLCRTAATSTRLRSGAKDGQRPSRSRLRSGSEFGFLQECELVRSYCAATNSQRGTARISQMRLLGNDVSVSKRGAS
jgi:hypothetical protein